MCCGEVQSVHSNMYEYVYINTAYRQNIDTQVQKVSCYGMQPDMGSGKVIQNME